MSKPIIERLRRLRDHATELNRSIVADLKPFHYDKNGIPFRRLPTKEPDGISVSTSCTILMALAMNSRLEDFYETPAARIAAKDAFELIVAAPWISSGLPGDNPFTRTLVLRTAGLLKEHGVLTAREAMKHEGESLPKIAEELAAGVPTSLKIQHYPPTTTLAYWFVDGVDRLSVNLSAEFWESVVDWSSNTFKQELSFVSAAQHAMMDPISMGMGACLTARLRTILPHKAPSTFAKLLKVLPSSDQIEHGLALLFSSQSDSGIWPKYFPLFYYPEGGVNYCFSFELLEALLSEFASWKILEAEGTLRGLERAVSWCGSANRFTNTQGEVTFCGWNSGTEIEPLRDRVPEAWATAVIHMFLWRLQETLSAMIDGHVRHRRASVGPTGPDNQRWQSLLDAPVEIQGAPTTVLTVIKDHILDPAERVTEHLRAGGTLRKRQARSVLLFGPPGTSKTSLVRAIAEKLGWPLIELTPSDFLRRGIDKIFKQTDQMFRDLSDLSGAVIFFDEMDAVAQKRKADLDITRQFLTTSMLPRIATLHDKAKVLFFMATNHISGLDEAITRPGRFDLLLFVGPPGWSHKLQRINKILVDVDVTAKPEIEEIGTILDGWTSTSTTEDKELVQFLDLFTYGEFVSFLRQLRGKNSLLTELRAMDKSAFRDKVQKWATHYLTLKEIALASTESDTKTARQEFEEDRLKSSIQY